MTRRKAPAFQFYANDWLADANVMTMSYQERGVYITLLAIAWNEGGIPADEKERAKLLALPARSLHKMWPAIERCWQANGNGQLVNPRLEKERSKQQAWREKSSRGGSTKPQAKAA